MGRDLPAVAHVWHTSFLSPHSVYFDCFCLSVLWHKFNELFLLFLKDIWLFCILSLIPDLLKHLKIYVLKTSVSFFFFCVEISGITWHPVLQGGRTHIDIHWKGISFISLYIFSSCRLFSVWCLLSLSIRAETWAYIFKNQRLPCCLLNMTSTLCLKRILWKRHEHYPFNFF